MESELIGYPNSAFLDSPGSAGSITSIGSLGWAWLTRSHPPLMNIMAIEGKSQLAHWLYFISLIPVFISLFLILPTFFSIRKSKTWTLGRNPRMNKVQHIRLPLQLTLMFLTAILFVYVSAVNSQVEPGLVAVSMVPAMLTSYIEVYKRTKPSGSVLIYFVALLITQIFDSFHLKKLHLLTSLLSLVIFGLEYFQPRRQQPDERFVNPYDEADIFSRLTFSWMTPLMRKGYESFLEAKDLPPLASNDRTDSCNYNFEKHWQNQLEQSPESPSMFRALLQSFGKRYALGGLCKAGQDVCAFAQPTLLKFLINFVEDYTESNGELPLTRGIYIALAMFLVSVMQTTVLHQYFERSFGVGMNVRTAVTNAIFRKSLVLSNEARATRTTGDTVNLMSIDTQRLQDVCTNGNMIWSGPLQITLCLLSLYKLVGNAMWIGVIVLIILVPINSRLAATQKRLQQSQMRDKDLRTRLTSELFSCIKSVKLFAWEDAFVDRLDHVRRDKELASLRKIGVFQASMSYIWSFTPFLVSCSTFAVYVFISKKPLSVDIVFPSLALFNMLGFPMAVFPMLISGLIEANVALKRISNYLVGEELQRDAVIRIPRPIKIGELGVGLENASFVYKRSDIASGDYVLKNVNLQAHKGELVCVVGRVGSGKSSLLLSILGDVYKASGKVQVGGDIAYVSQNPWIFNGSVRENILFGRVFDEEMYNETIAACALQDDLAILPDGDLSIVGEKGLSLSGGQKARVSLARAVYAGADVYLLDDPLSAVDEHVGQHIIQHVLSKSGLLATKTVILATNSIPVLNLADKIAMLVKGQIVEQGTGTNLTNSPRIQVLLRDFGRKDNTDVYSRESSAAQSRRGSMVKPSLAPLTKVAPAELRKEHTERGKVSWSVYKEYAKVCGYKRIMLFLFVLNTSTLFSLFSNVWLKHWAENNTDAGKNSHVLWYLGVYSILGVSSAALSVLQSLVAYVVINIHAALTLHDKMLHAVVKAPMSFFETTPLGRLVNRFSSDVYRVDQQLARVFTMLFTNCIKVFVTIVIICYSTPLFIAIALPLTYFYYYYQQYYLKTSRELKRLDSVSKSPIFAQFQETLDGIATVRAFDATSRFNHNNQCFIDANNQAYFPSISANRWLAVRLEFVGSIVIFGASSLAVLSLPSGRLTAGVIGLALSYALQVTQSLNWIVRMTVEVETNIVSVERMLEYSELTPEAPAVIPTSRPPPQWPPKGQVQLNNYSTRYRPELPLVLRDINLSIKAGEKIGIVGRTGAGKSSLTLAIFRLIEPTQGFIVIDGVNTSDIGLKDLRSNLSIIPQDAQLFQGTVTENLDPQKKYTEEQLWHALELAHLKDHITEMGGLNSQISEGGSNLSSGQRQLLSLSRALLTDSKILVLDEATAAVDVETDNVIQQVIKHEFKDRTILTIAHRLNTIIDSDKVVVLSFGEIAEFDDPKKLLEDPNSQFYSLCKRGGVCE